MKNILMAAAARAALYDVNAFDRGHSFGRKDAGGAGGADDIAAAVRNFEAATDKVKAFAEDAKGRLEKGEQLSTSTKSKVDEALTEMNGLKSAVEGMKATVGDLEQKLSRRPGPEAQGAKSLGELVIENEGMKGLMTGASKRGSVHVALSKKDITSAPASVGPGVSPGTSLVRPDRQAIVNLPDRRLTIRDLLTPGETMSSNIEYPVETGFANNAAAVVEGALKPQSNLTFDLKSVPVRTLAHWMRASRQILDDAPQLQSYIDGRLQYGLQYVEEAQLLFGDGTGQNLLGIVPQASVYAEPFAPAAETAIDRIRMALLQASLALYPSTGIVLNDIDWAKIELTKDTQGRYIIASPGGDAVTTLWKLPVVATQAMTPNHFLVGAFKIGAQIFDRMQIEVLISTEDQDNFVKNMITIRGEERLGLAVYRPTAFVTGLVTPAA